MADRNTIGIGDRNAESAVLAISGKRSQVTA
jgi:hypothetical protein